MNVKIDIPNPRVLIRPGALLAAALAAWLLVVPEVEAQYDRHVRSYLALRSETQQLSAEITQIRADIAQIEKLQAPYAALRRNGVIGDQNRLAAADTIERLGRETQVQGLRYALLPERVESDPLLTSEALAVVATNIDVSMGALTDREALAFLGRLGQSLPGRVTITGLRMDKVAPITEAATAGANAERQEFLTAAAQAVWYTLRPLPKPEGQ